MNNHSLQHTEAEPIRRWNDRTRNRRTHEIPSIASFHGLPKPLYTEKRKVSCSSFPANASLMQHSCSHCTAICNQRVNKRKESRTHEQPLLAEHRGGTDSTLKRPQPHRSHTEVASIAGRSHFAQKRHKVSCSGFPPNTSPMQHSCSHDTAIQAKANPSQPSWAPISQSHSILYFESSPTLLIVIWCSTHTPPPFIEYSLTLLIVMWCSTHYHSLSIVSHF